MDLQENSVGDILKPKIVADTYATIKIEHITIPREKTYDEAKEEVTLAYSIQAKKEALFILAESHLKDFNQSTAIISDFVQIEKNINMKPLNSQESVAFLQKLFTSTQEKGIISVMDKIIVYNILEQKIIPMDNNQSLAIKETVDTLKNNIFERNLIDTLDKKYPTEAYVNGL
ncbi:MAG: hypothetical protein Q9M36_01335 [Sulfurovum sp.]|nr:hypothetical protein [Sulfurovum sp.]